MTDLSPPDAIVPEDRRSLPFVTEGIRPRFVVASHLQYTGTPPDEARIRRNFSNAVVPRTEGERWVIP